MSSPTNCMYRTIPQPSQEPALLCTSGSSPQTKRFCSVTTNLLSATSFTRCVQTEHLAPFFFVVVVYETFSCEFFILFYFFLCRLLMMWRKASSKLRRSLISYRSWQSWRRCPWLVSHTYRHSVVRCSSECVLFLQLTPLLCSCCVNTKTRLSLYGGRNITKWNKLIHNTCII